MRPVRFLARVALATAASYVSGVALAVVLFERASREMP